MTWRRMPVLLLLAVMLMGQGAGGVGLFVRSDCTTLTSPVTGQSWCFDATAQLPKVWNGASWAQSPPTPVANIVAGTSRLTYVSGTSIQLGLGVIPLKVSGTWIMRPITTVVTCNNTGLADSTTYFVYMYDAPGTTCTISATGHSTDSAYGVETLTGDATRTLVGMVRTNASTHQFENDLTNGGQSLLIGVLSWYNPRPLAQTTTFSVARSTAGGYPVELNAEIRNGFLTWGDKAVSVVLTAAPYAGTGGTAIMTGVAFDGGTTEAGVYKYAPVANQGETSTVTFVKNGLSEGYHYATVYGGAGGASTQVWPPGYGNVGATTTSTALGVMVSG